MKNEELIAQRRRRTGMENKIDPARRPPKPLQKRATPPLPAEPPRPRQRKKQLPPSKARALPVPRKKAPRRPLPWRKWLADLVALSVLFGGSSLMASGAWLSVQLIVDPDAGVWLNKFLPEWTRIPLRSRGSIQTLEQIRATLRQEGLSTGESLALPKDPGKKDRWSEGNSDLLLPVLATRPSRHSAACKNPCQQIVELRVYQAVSSPHENSGKEQYFRLVNQIPVEGPAESFAIASLIDAQGKQGSNQSLPLTSVSSFKGRVPSSGFWFYMSGQLVQGDAKIPYGQVLHYNPKSFHLMVMLDWTSVAGQPPSWQQITGGGQPELVIDETIGLEPEFQVYQLQPRQFAPNPFQLATISLEEPALDSENYREALRLARSGLWSPALERMLALKRKYPGTWPTQAQTQLDIVQFHAKITQAQAQASWATPSQQALADLIDGRWISALEVFKVNLLNSYEISKVLKKHGERLWNRVDTSLKLNLTQEETQTWGALIVSALDGRNEASAWLAQQDNLDREAKARIRALLDQLDEAIAKGESLKLNPNQAIAAPTTVNSRAVEQLSPSPQPTTSN